MSQLPVDLSSLDSTDRLNALRGRLLERGADPELQALVQELARVLRFPTAMVSLVLQDTQFFKAHVGLPPDLAAAQATDRCTSFCQFVTASDRPLTISDSHQEPLLPRDLIERYGIRAYHGAPLHVDGQVVGSLCVTDQEPRQLSDDELVQLQRLADRASARLQVLAVAGDQNGGDTLALAEMQAPLRLAEAFAEGKLTEEEFDRGSGALKTLSGRPR
jgi:GAF domain-containing protein